MSDNGTPILRHEDLVASWRQALQQTFAPPRTAPVVEAPWLTPGQTVRFVPPVGRASDIDVLQFLMTRISAPARREAPEAYLVRVACRYEARFANVQPNLRIVGDPPQRWGAHNGRWERQYLVGWQGYFFWVNDDGEPRAP